MKPSLSPLPVVSLSGDKTCLDLSVCAALGHFDSTKLPRPLLILLENVVVNEGLKPAHLAAFAAWLSGGEAEGEIPFRPGRILSHDTAGIALLVDLAALRDRMAEEGRDPRLVNSAVPIDLVVDHSVAVDVAGSPSARADNFRLEFSRNLERYRFLKWAEAAFDNLRIIPPGNGICHQVNVEFLASGVLPASGHAGLICADTVIGTDSHTTMINALGILGWGVGGIEAEAVALGQPQMMSLPEVTGCRLVGRRRRSVSGADIALTVMNTLREHGVVGKFVEFFGDGLDDLASGDRAGLANMAPEYGATCGLFPIDQETVRYLRETGRAEAQIDTIVAHARAIGLWRDDERIPRFSDTITIDLGDVVPVVAGPRRPQEKVPLPDTAESFRAAFPPGPDDASGGLRNGDIVIAAISSCTHTSNAHQMLAAGLLARNARRAGLQSKPWVKTSLSPGSRMVEEYFRSTGLQDDLDALGFHVTGFGCMTCAGNPGPLAPEIAAEVKARSLIVCSILSGNRNFEGRTHPDIRASYLGSPALVIAYALAGTMLIDLSNDPIGIAANGAPIHLDDLWPSEAEIVELAKQHLRPSGYAAIYARESLIPPEWLAIEAPVGALFPWDDASTHIRRPPFFGSEATRSALADIQGARPLAVLGDNITTDHISPFGSILPGSAAAMHLEGHGVAEEDWSTYAEHRGNHEVLLRGTFSNPRIRNALAQGRVGSLTTGPSGELDSIMAAADAYQAAGIPTVVFAGKAYGTGSARDWAAKGTFLIGVKAVIAESFERIHRNNLVGVGVVPCQLPLGVTVDSLDIGPETTVAVEGLTGLNGPRATVRLVLIHRDGTARTIPLTCRIDTEAEVTQFRHGGLFASAEEVVKARSVH